MLRQRAAEKYGWVSVSDVFLLLCLLSDYQLGGCLLVIDQTAFGRSSICRKARRTCAQAQHRRCCRGRAPRSAEHTNELLSLEKRGKQGNEKTQGEAGRGQLAQRSTGEHRETPKDIICYSFSLPKDIMIVGMVADEHWKTQSTTSQLARAEPAADRQGQRPSSLMTCGGYRSIHPTIR